jgi:hypothetical protein
VHIGNANLGPLFNSLLAVPADAPNEVTNSRENVFLGLLLLYLPVCALQLICEFFVLFLGCYIT